MGCRAGLGAWCRWQAPHCTAGHWALFEVSSCRWVAPSPAALLTGDTGLIFICLLLFFSAAFMLEARTQVLKACLEEPTNILKGHSLGFEVEFNTLLGSRSSPCSHARGCILFSMVTVLPDRQQARWGQATTEDGTSLSSPPSKFRSAGLRCRAWTWQCPFMYH